MEALNIESGIKDVFAHNMDEAFREIARILPRYNIIAFDTEFPGCFESVTELQSALNVAYNVSMMPFSPAVADLAENILTKYPHINGVGSCSRQPNQKDEAFMLRQMYQRSSDGQLHPIRPAQMSFPNSYAKYQTNSQYMKLIQIGMTFADINGICPENIHTWQFHFSFDVNTDTYKNESVGMLHSHNLPFNRLILEGINPVAFGSALIENGLLYNPRVLWVCFHGSSDFCYLLGTALNCDLPVTYKEFLALMQVVFPAGIYDLKNEWQGSLETMGSNCNLIRRGESHQAGSDAHLTMQIYLQKCRSRGRGRDKPLLGAQSWNIYGFDK